jgi:pimeloyl-ACP methyl ester carboxylesterase
MTAASGVERKTVEVNGTRWSYLEAGSRDAPPLLLLHGTFWSRVWQPVLPELGRELHCLALDFPGFGKSGGELDVASAAVPALAQAVLKTADVLEMGKFMVAGHDIGGGVAQHLAAYSRRVTRLVLVNSVMFDSWPVPAVAKYRDPAVRSGTGPAELLAARTKTMPLTVQRPLSAGEIAEYASPWQDPARARSWMAMAGAADSRYTLDLLPELKAESVPTRLIWGGTTSSKRSPLPAGMLRKSPPATSWKCPANTFPWRTCPVKSPWQCSNIFSQGSGRQAPCGGSRLQGLPGVLSLSGSRAGRRFDLPGRDPQPIQKPVGSDALERKAGNTDQQYLR